MAGRSDEAQAEAFEIVEGIAQRMDAQKFTAFVREKSGLALAQKVAGEVLQRRQELQALNMGRQVTALGKVEARERQALSVKTLRAQRVQQRGRA